jgi:hypothetical protein
MKESNADSSALIQRAFYRQPHAKRKNFSNRMFFAVSDESTKASRFPGFHPQEIAGSNLLNASGHEKD